MADLYASLTAESFKFQRICTANSIPRSPSILRERETATIHALPNELLLQVAQSIQGRHRNTTLCSLSLVSRRFAPIAQEVLICDPRFHLGQIHNYLWTLGHHSTWIPKIWTLEIWSSSCGRDFRKREMPVVNTMYRASVALCFPAVRAPPGFWTRNKEFWEMCMVMVKFNTPTLRKEIAWKSALGADIIPALLGVLLVSLHGLKELRIAATWLMDFPVFADMPTSEVTRTLPVNWRHDYMCKVLNTLQEKLEVLEFPTDLRHMYFLHRPRGLFDFRAFANLTELSLPNGVLAFTETRTAPVEPWTILPRTLLLLRITEATSTTANFINSLCLAYKQNRFPVLHRIELYFTKHCHVVQQRAKVNHHLDPYWDTKHICANVGLELSLYFSGTEMRTGDAGRSLWALREDGELGDVEDENFSKRMGSFGVKEEYFRAHVCEWDAEGDVLMGTGKDIYDGF